MKKVWSLVLSSVMLTNIFTAVPVNANEYIHDNIFMYNVDENADSYTRDSKQILDLNEELYTSGNAVVVYGHNLDVDYFNHTLFKDTAILKITPSDEPVSSSKETTTTANNSRENQLNQNKTDDMIALTPCELYEGQDTSVTETYAIIAYNNNGKITLRYCSINYPIMISVSERESIYSECLNDTNLQELTQEFVARKSVRSAIADDVTDTNDAYRFYTPNNSSQSYKMLMYQKNITMQAHKVDDLMSDRDFYYFTADAYVTPGNSLPQTYPNYKNAIVVSGAQTDFWLPSSKPNDQIYSASPIDNSLVDMVAGSYTFPISVGIDSGGDISLSFTWTPTNPVKRSSMNDGRRFNNAYLGNSSFFKYCISTSQFSYQLGCAARVFDGPMRMNAQNCIRVHFQNQPTSAMEWITNTFLLSYTP